MVETIYKRVLRISEVYIFACFLLITFVPLLQFSWVQEVVYFIYFTGFSLLIILLLTSFMKDAILDMLKQRFEPGRQRPSHPKTSRDQ